RRRVYFDRLSLRSARRPTPRHAARDRQGVRGFGRCSRGGVRRSLVQLRRSAATDGSQSGSEPESDALSTVEDCPELWRTPVSRTLPAMRRELAGPGRGLLRPRAIAEDIRNAWRLAGDAPVQCWRDGRRVETRRLWAA